jgi:hypothetical protein
MSLFGVSFIGPDDKVASGRYRCIMPARHLYKKGWKMGDDVVVTMKHQWPEDFSKKGKSYIFDVCDDHFKTHRDHYVKHCKEADFVTCNSEEMSKIIKRETGRDSLVIPDPVESDRQPAHFSESGLWFGNKWNFKPLTRYAGRLPSNIQVISEPFAPFVTPWSKANLKKGFEKAGYVLIPVGEKKAKSANRLLEAMYSGCFVICEPMPAYDEFKDFCWIGDLADGIEWYLKNPKKALEMTRKGQEYISKNYTIEQIGKLWERALHGAYKPTHILKERRA